MFHYIGKSKVELGKSEEILKDEPQVELTHKYLLALSEFDCFLRIIFYSFRFNKITNLTLKMIVELFEFSSEINLTYEKN